MKPHTEQHKKNIALALRKSRFIFRCSVCDDERCVYRMPENGLCSKCNKLYKLHILYKKLEDKLYMKLEGSKIAHIRDLKNRARMDAEYKFRKPIIDRLVGEKYLIVYKNGRYKKTCERCGKTWRAGTLVLRDNFMLLCQKCLGIKQSADSQGIPLSEWTEYSKDDWRDWNKAIYVNEPFIGCHRHHMTETIVAHIPEELHRHIYHNLKKGANMGEINMLAIQFINGGL